jgi:hypothetical protein
MKTNTLILRTAALFIMPLQLMSHYFCCSGAMTNPAAVLSAGL